MLFRSGNVVIRAKHHLEKGDGGKTNIIIDEIPVGLSGNKGALVPKIIDLVVDKTLTEVSDVRDESSKDGIRVVIEVKKGQDIDNVLNKLYSKTQLQMSEHYNFLVSFDGRPKIVNLKTYLEDVAVFHKDCIVKKYQYLLKKIYERREIVEGLINAIDVLDIIIEVSR